jgi:uncharacterized membrane protein (DUF4010 family)
MELQPLDALYRLGSALLVGALIGFERGWRKRDEPQGTRTAGLRTFSLVGLFGGIAGVIEPTGSAVLIAAGIVAVGALAVAMYAAAVRSHGNIGATTEVTTLVVFGLGVLAGRGNFVLAIASAVVVVALLDMKALLHGAMLKVRHDELRAAIKLLLVSAVLLPILPDSGYGPGGVLNPYRLWWIVVLVSALSLAGHFAQRLVGPRHGIIAMGLVGGLVSSTALTVSAARLAAANPANSQAQAAAVVAAKAVMCLRILIVAAALNAALLRFLLPSLVAAALAGLAMAFLAHRRGRASNAETDGRKHSDDLPVPDDFVTAIIFALVVAAAIVGTHYARLWLGPVGLYATAALAGVVDVDAVTVTAAMSDAGVALSAGAILVAAGVNTVAKIGIAASLGPRDFAGRVGMMMAGVLAAGAAGAAAAFV